MYGNGEDDWGDDDWEALVGPPKGRCGHKECWGYVMCQMHPYIDCSGFTDPPLPNDQWRMEYPIEHGPRCKGHKRYVYGIQISQGRLMPPCETSGTIKPLGRYL